MLTCGDNYAHVLISAAKALPLVKTLTFIYNSSLLHSSTAQVGKLSALGFQEADCRRALKECGGRLDDAALWLTHNAHPLPAPTLPTTPSTQEKAINFHAIEVFFKLWCTNAIRCLDLFHKYLLAYSL